MRRVTVIPGDGIGPSVIQCAQRAVEATGVDIEWREARAGEAALEECGSPLPDATLESVAATGVALKGPCGTPVGKGFRSVNVAMRKEFDLYANVRPARAFAGVKCRYPKLDLLTIRENTEGLYSQMEHWTAPTAWRVWESASTRAAIWSSSAALPSSTPARTDEKR